VKLIKYISIVSIIGIFYACGGGTSSTSSSTTDSTSSSVAAATTYSGQFIDAPTKGLLYSASPSGLTGTTDASGTFKFQAGDVVTFEIPTSGGNIPIGVHSPTTPTSATEVSILHVSTMDNGTQIAQTLQSLSSGTKDMLDLSNVKLTAEEKSQFANYISTGATSTLPPKLTVSEADALFNAMASLGNLPVKDKSSDLSSFLKGQVIVHTGIANVKLASGGAAGKTIAFLNNSVSYFKSDNTTWDICVNSAWIDKQFANESGNNCKLSGINKMGTWAIPENSKNLFTLSFNDFPNYLNTVTLKDINSKQGLYTNSEPYAYDNVEKFTGYGEYIFMSNTWNRSLLASTTYYASGVDTCTGGLLKAEYSKDATTFNVSCKISRVDGAANTPTLGGTLSDVNEIPGLAKITSPNGSISYVGVAAGSNEKSGRSILIKVGDNLCGTAGTEGGKNRSLDHCGSIKISTYFK